MPIVGAVLELFPGTGVPEPIRLDPRVEVGGRIGNRVPVVIVTTTLEEERALFDAARALPGVVAVLVAFADVSDLHPTLEEFPYTAEVMP